MIAPGGFRLLVVDDDSQVRCAIRRSLKRLDGIVIEDFGIPAEALERFRESPFDGAILDIQMPGMSGIDLARELQRLKPRFPLLFMTGQAPSDLRQAAKDMGAPVLAKPWEVDELVGLVRSLAGQP